MGSTASFGNEDAFTDMYSNQQSSQFQVYGAGRRRDDKRYGQSDTDLILEEQTRGDSQKAQIHHISKVLKDKVELEDSVDAILNL